MQRALRVLLGLVTAAALLPLFSATASAVVAPPTPLSPQDGSAWDTNPVFTWTAAPGANKYRIEVSRDIGFSTVDAFIDTVNVNATFTNDLPNAQLFWHVASRDANNNLGPYSQTFTFTKTRVGPDPIAPLGTDASFPSIQYPNEPVTFSWNPLPNTTTYTLEIDDDVDFTPPLIFSDTTKNPIYSWSTPTQMNKKLYWHVKATSPQNFVSPWSNPQAFQIAWGYTPQLVYPAHDSTIEEVRFDWNGGPNPATPGTPFKTTPGATTYDLLVSSDVNFNTIVLQKTGIQATAYTPLQTLPASDYYWKVRARNAAGVISAYSSIFHFKRVWPTTPPPPDGPDGNNNISLLAPADTAVVIEPNLSWSPSRLASKYEVWLSTDPNFSPGNVLKCQTTHTSVTPYSPQCQIFPNIGATYYWKVLPIDQPTGIQGVFSNRRSFIYNPQQPAPPATNIGPLTYLTPDGKQFGPTETPVLAWNPAYTTAQTPITNPETAPLSEQTGFGRYLVQVFKNGGFFGQWHTYNTAIVPPVQYDLGPDPDGGGPLEPPPVTTYYTYTVTVENDRGQLGLTYPERSFSVMPRSGSFAPTITTPAGTAGVNAPLLSWTPVTNATRYDVFYGVRGTGIFNAQPLNVNAYQITQNGFVPESDAKLTSGDWDFYVQAYDKTSAAIASSGISWFRINELPAPRLTSPANCTENPQCIVLPDTPTLDWDPVPRATNYLVTIATDENFTNVLHTYDADTPYTKLRLVQALPDNQAGSNSYYWYARPCIGNRCGPGPETYVGLPSCYRVPNLAPGTPCSPVRSFIKKSNQTTMLSPSSPTATDEITFHWEDFLKTNRNTPPPSAGTPQADQEAQNYHIEVATTPNFQPGTVIDTKDIDATTYTDEQLYRDGPLYWHVQPRDGSNNLLTNTAVGQILKTSPTINLSIPADGANVKGVPVFSWPAQPYASDYKIEVYKSPDQGPQPGNLMFGAPITQTPAYAPRVGLPAGTYGWRVKYRDAQGNESAFSTGLRTFTLAPDAVTLTGPADGKLVAGNRVLFTWQKPSSNYASYKIQVATTAAFTTIVDQQTTVTNGHAPINVYQNGTWYWRVLLLDGNNNVLSTSSVRSVLIGQPGVTYKPVAPTRLLDSRLASSQWGGTKLFQGAPRALQVTGGVIPANATAIIANVTATGGSAASFLTVYPADENTPNASNVNFAAGQTIPNLVTVKLSGAGAIKIANAVGNTDVILDVVGYFDDGTVINDSFTGIAPVRVLDSRQVNGPWAGTKLQANVPRTLQVSGGQSIPSDATAAVMNVTVTGSTMPSFLTVYPGGQVPTASNLNYGAGETIPNLVVSPLNGTGQASFFTPQGATDVIVDVVGYFSPTGDKFHVMSPKRIVDSRTNNQDPLNAAWNSAKLGITPRALQVAGVVGVPQDATGVVMNTTVTGGTLNSFVTVYPDGVTKPNSSNLNFAAGQTIPNLVMVKLGANSAQFPAAQGKVDIANQQGSVDIIGDVVGYFAAQ